MDELEMAMARQRLRSETGNRLLSSLARADRALLEPYLKPVELKLRERLETADRKIKAVYFIERGLGSVVGIGSGQRRQAEVAIVGREGMSGVSLLLGVDRSPHDVFMQLEGSGQCITSSDLRRVMSESRSLTACLLRYLHVFAVQMAHTAVANAKGKIEERLARWLLMAHDRIEGDDLRLTHEFLALMLGSRRAGVTTALQKLEAAKLVGNARGCITILDRDGLTRIADGLYGVPEAEFDRLFATV
jgi:CRP-like cAMP-binding protein